MDTRVLAQNIDGVLEGLKLECLGIEWNPSGGQSRLRVYIDQDDGDVTVDDCAAASREISAWLDVEDSIPGHYVLEVSSPGLDRPLFTAEQYRQVVGQQIKLALKLPREGRRRFSGEVVAVHETQITLRMDNDELELRIVDIDKARVVPDWETLGYAPAAKLGGKRKASPPVTGRFDKNTSKRGNTDAGADGNE